MKIKYTNITNKIIAMLCVFVMTCSTVMAAGTSATGTSEIDAKDLYTVELLNAIGIYDGVDSIVGKDAFVRRDVMAYLVARIIGMSDAVHQGESLFSDVDKDNFAYNAINILAQMNIVEGTSTGKFEPTKDITLDEATEIILRIMGYSKLIDLQGDVICTKLAQDHNLHKGIKYAKDKRLQVKYLSALLINALTSEFPQLVYVNGGGIEYEIEKGENLLSKTFDVYEIEGVISANGHTSVDVVTSGDHGWIKIGNRTFNVGKTDAEKYIGYYVTAYYLKGDVNTLLCINVESTNTVVVIDSNDVEFKNFQYITYENNRKKIYAVSRALNLIYNGKAIYYDKAKMVPAYGTITLINNNQDKAYDTVIVNSVRNMVVGGYGSTSNIIQSKYDKNPIDLNKYDESSYSIHKADGKPYKAASLKEWDILSIIESDDQKYLDITVSTESVVGSIEKIKDANGVKMLTIDGVQYEVAKTFLDDSNYDLKIGYSGTFYFDMFGRIAAANAKINQLKWGYLIKSRLNDEAFSRNYFIQMLTQDSSTVKIFETSDKLTVDNFKYTSSNIDTLVLQDYQPVRYSLDKSGKINKLYTKASGDFLQIAGRSSRGFVSNVFVANQIMDIAVDSNTVFLQIPNTAAGDKQDNVDFYQVLPLSSFVRDGWYIVSAYGFAEDDVLAPMVLVDRYTSTAATPGGTYMVVSEIQVCLNKDGDPVNKIIGYDIKKNKVEILTKDTTVAATAGIEEGDFFAMVLYPDGVLQRAVQLYDCKTSAFNSNYKARDFNTTYFARFAYAYDMSGNYLLLSDDPASFTGRKVLNASSAAVLLVDSSARGDIVKPGALSDIQTYRRSTKASKIVFFGSNSVPNVIVCYL